MHNSWFIKGLEDPQFKLSYTGMNKKINTYQKILYVYFTVFTLVPGILMYIYVLIIYFTRDLESEDYLLPYPIW